MRMLILLLVASFASANGYHGRTHPDDHPLTPMVNSHEADPTICTTWITPEWSAATYKWVVENATNKDVKKCGRGVSLALRYSSGATIDVAGPNGPQVVLGRTTASEDYTALRPGQSCYGVYDPSVAAEAALMQERLIIEADELAPANTGTRVEQRGLTFYNDSYYVVGSTQERHNVAAAKIGRNVVHCNELH